MSQTDQMLFGTLINLDCVFYASLDSKEWGIMVQCGKFESIPDLMSEIDSQGQDGYKIDQVGVYLHSADSMVWFTWPDCQLVEVKDL